MRRHVANVVLIVVLAIVVPWLVGHALAIYLGVPL